MKKYTNSAILDKDNLSVELINGHSLQKVELLMGRFRSSVFFPFHPTLSGHNRAISDSDQTLGLNCKHPIFFMKNHDLPMLASSVFEVSGGHYNLFHDH